MEWEQSLRDDIHPLMSLRAKRSNLALSSAEIEILRFILIDKIGDFAPRSLRPGTSYDRRRPDGLLATTSREGVLVLQMSFRAKREIPVMLLLLVSSLEMKRILFCYANRNFEPGQEHKYFRRITLVNMRRYARQCRRPTQWRDLWPHPASSIKFEHLARWEMVRYLCVMLHPYCCGASAASWNNTACAELTSRQEWGSCAAG